MTIHKNDLAILEFDDAYESVIEPNHEGLDIKLPKKCVFGFLYYHIDDYAIKNKAKPWHILSRLQKPIQFMLSITRAMRSV